MSPAKPIDTTTLDPGICEVVRFLRDNGFETTDSGDGVTKFQTGGDTDDVRPVPHVTMRVADPADLIAECSRLAQLLTGNGVVVTSLGPLGQNLPVVMDEAVIEGIYLTADNLALIDLTLLNDDGLRLARSRLPSRGA